MFSYALIGSTPYLKAAVIDLDLSFVVQLAVFLLLYLLLSNFFFKPYARFLKRRDSSTAGLKAQASDLLLKAAALEDSSAKRLEEARQAGMEERKKLAAEGTRVRNELISRERERVQARVDKEIAGLNAERDAFIMNADVPASQLAALIEGQLNAAEGGN